MLHVLGCITEQHDPRLVVLAALLCLFACTTAMTMIARGRASEGRMRTVWLLAGGVVAGCGIWGLHFVAMLAYRPGLPVAYDTSMTILSVFVAPLVCALGFRLALTPAGGAVGGAVTGLAISAMHYIGMAAVRIPAVGHWDAGYVAASLLIGVLATALGLHIAIKRGDVRGYSIGAALFSLAIVGMHFTAMSAVVYVPDPTIVVSGVGIEPSVLAIAVASSVALIMALGLIGALVDHHLAARATGEAERLRAHVTALEETQRKLEATSADLSAALTAADSANRTKSQFLAAMSHELRTPLNAVIGFSEMLKMEMFGPLGHVRYGEYARDIQSSGAHLLALINDILDLSRLDTEQLDLSDKNVEIAELIEAAVQMLSGQAAKANIRLEYEIQTDLPMVRVDKRRMHQVLINLLSNAVKFTPADGRVLVSASCAGEGIAVSVSDTGIGIAEADMAKAFERFAQIDSDLSRRYEGAGLGLPIARRLVELHGGTLELRSQLHAGTTATVTLPPERIVEPAGMPALAVA